MTEQNKYRRANSISTKSWRRDKVFAAALALVFGLVGGHHFYLGNTGKGFLYLFSFFLIWTVIVPIVMYCICIVEAVSYFFASDADFDNKFNNHQVLS